MGYVLINLNMNNTIGLPDELIKALQSLRVIVQWRKTDLVTKVIVSKETHFEYRNAHCPQAFQFVI